jgi:alginate O-acetyltransferase complex protein AlgI
VLFNSYIFLFAFLPTVLIVWWSLRPPTARLTFLTLASYFFYGWWDWRFIPLLVASTSVDFVSGRMISASDDPRRRKLVLATALTINLALLGYFKYAGFFVDSLNGIGSWFGAGDALPALHIVLPIGISFYTFNSMSYTIDIYRRVVRPVRNFLHYAAFVSLFPHLIAGPIVRYSDIDQQLRALRPRLTSKLAASGLFFLCCGLVKKLVIADRLAPDVSRLFDNHAHLDLLTGWAAALGYSLQLYFDFSGYSDMAVGLAFLLGFRFPQNFNSPYQAVNISDFWRRWHMSLSFWLRDYLFIPLGGSRGSRAATLRNLTLTMFVGGLWHGAAWTFVVWGLIHGVYLAVHNLARNAGLTPRSPTGGRAITYVCVVAAFVVFRAPTLSVAADVLGAMAGLHGLGTLHGLSVDAGFGFVLAVLGLLVFVNVVPNTWNIRLEPRLRYGLAVGFAAGFALLLLAQPSPFIYFQF